MFNDENTDTTFQLNDSFDDTNRRFVWRIQESEVREALKRMKGGKAMGPDGIPIEVWRCLGDIVIVWLTNRGVEMPQGHSYSMANQVVQLYFSIEQDA